VRDFTLRKLNNPIIIIIIIIIIITIIFIVFKIKST